MLFRVWLIRYDEATFKPKHWQDNPASGIADSRGHQAVDIDKARKAVKGFNEQEIADPEPTGCWAIICNEGTEPVQGQQVILERINPEPSLN